MLSYQMKEIKQIETMMHADIPMAKAMGISIISATTEKVVLEAPLKLNHNHKQTVFGGSLNAAATLACWTLLQLNVEEYSEKYDIVVMQTDVKYLLPVSTDFRVFCESPDNQVWDKFKKMLYKKQISRIPLSAYVYQQEQLALDFRGSFAVTRL